jgi:enamine deaminase RidA (YjgF/YER057c/UK114 family)
VFGEILPASAFVGVNELLHPDLMIEVEATAIVRT